MNPRQKLQVIHGERRTRKREFKDSEHLLSGSIGLSRIEGASLVSVGFGSMTLLLTNQAEFSEGEYQNIELRSGFELKISGNFLVKVCREKDEGILIVIEHPNLSEIRNFENSFSPEVLMRCDQSRILRFGDAGDRSEVGRLFTDLADHTSLVEVKLIGKETQFKAEFDFSSKMKELKNISFKPVMPKREFKLGEFITVSFKFLTVQYMFFSKIIEIDLDFDLLIVDLPEVIVALTTRRYDRMDCKLKAEILSGSSIQNGRIINISPLGCEMEFESAGNINIGDQISIRTDSTTSPVIGKIKSANGTRFGIEFLKGQESIRDLFNSSVSRPYSLRTEDQYRDFSKIYGKVGYDKKVGTYDKDPYPFDEWAKRSQLIWRLQDQRLPGNMIGTYDGEELTSSFGILPMSETIAYGHSLAMEKKLSSIATCFDLALFNISSTELIPSIKYFLGAASLDSSFSTKLYKVFEACASPMHQTFFFSKRLSTGKEAVEHLIGERYEIEESTLSVDEIPENKKLIISNMRSSHPLLSDIHEIKHYRVCENGKTIAFVVAQSGPEFTTAANFFRIAWCFEIAEAIDVDKLYRTLHAVEFIRPLQLNFFSTDLSRNQKVLKSARTQDEIMFFLIDKNEMGPICASIARTVYAVLKKYGNDASSYLERVAS